MGGALAVGGPLDEAGPSPGPGADRSAPGIPPTPIPSPPPSPTPRPVEFTLLAAGDLLTHSPVVASAGGTDDPDFTPLLAGLDAWVQGADLALCHLEVPVAPKGTAPSGYPLFGAPPGLVRDLQEQGWDGCSTASNHSVDRGYDGVTATIRRLAAAGMGFAGTARSADQQDEPQRYVLTREGREITVAHLAATYGLNGLPMPPDAPWAVDLIDADRLVQQARAAREDGADVVVVSLHAGVEYTEELTEQQEEVVRRLARSREVDLVIGHHAHIPQRIDRLGKGPDGAGMWVAYGLGNLLSNQSADCCDVRTSNGVLLSATFAQDAPGDPVRMTDVSWTPTTVDIGGGHDVLALPDALEDPAATTLSGAELAARQERVRDAVGDAAPEREEPPETTGPPPQVLPRDR
ncbi:poly-gamma-glutamate synthesis protein (capsule biosynthesis protein) [Krasilnikoviella flava]|uniref:Poly-gamma-glutamate synthesis protein (Capsule biosynthesis protein) n=1 Tax=Krasilnikoviella flava TaxID=526729 RepID=A0A1T5LT82_9MICO|nr:poly-gamma-glutamate synthesis protein (capsule biosynthesis protein) [Krasilnikoviella flava]